MSLTAAAAPQAIESPGGASLRGPHRLIAVDTCQRAWKWRYYDYIRGHKDNPWRLGGTLLHTCYEYFYASMMDEKPAWFHQEDLYAKLEKQGRGYPELIEMAKANLAEYMEWYADDRHNLKPLHIEKDFWATLGELDPGGPWPELDDEVVTCRSDLVYESDAGIWILDYKTFGASKVNRRTGRLFKWKPDGEFHLNFQVMMNLHILRQPRYFGASLNGFVIQRSTRQAPFDFDRHPLTIPTLAYQETPRNIRRLVKKEHETMAMVARGEDPPASLGYACIGRYGYCDYRDAREAFEQLLTAYRQIAGVGSLVDLKQFQITDQLFRRLVAVGRIFAEHLFDDPHEFIRHIAAQFLYRRRFRVDVITHDLGTGTLVQRLTGQHVVNTGTETVNVAADVEIAFPACLFR